MTPHLKSALDALADHDTEQVWTLVPLLDDNEKDRVMLSAMVHGLDDIAAKIYQSQPHLDDGSCQELMDLLPSYIERQNIQAQVEGGAAPNPRPKKL